MSQIIPFSFEAHQVRVIMNHAGEPWFVAADVCAALSIANSRDAVARLDADEKGVVVADTLGGSQRTTTVSEPGVYRLVFTSRVESAERFKRWLAHEVLPSIRKTGAYSVPAPTATAPLTYTEALQRIVVLQQQLLDQVPVRRPPAQGHLGGPGAPRNRVDRPEHPWKEPIRAWLEARPELAEVGTTRVLTEALGIALELVTTAKQGAAGRVMASLGWARGRRRTAGVLSWVYVRPSAPTRSPARGDGGPPSR